MYNGRKIGGWLLGLEKIMTFKNISFLFKSDF